ncbi:hypothetical protein Y032_0056g2684 [Ancylostoma ceylanicum]|uniref:Uncharacterized protein n=1 Tax=Ancylostoma ceylanicum TaxID=53326 RepID=A0A016U6U3_9BILA|nr:hypothetical protein Y032_0056g2684 [Ancylostoma ceylanicum]
MWRSDQYASFSLWLSPTSPVHLGHIFVSTVCFLKLTLASSPRLNKAGRGCSIGARSEADRLFSSNSRSASLRFEGYPYPVDSRLITVRDLLHLHFALFLVKTPHLRQEMNTWMD